MAKARGKLVVGLAGGIGAGKSTVARILAENGLAIIDSDRLNHEELGRPEVVETLVRWFGSEVLGSEGSLRREAVSEIVFNDAGQRARLEALLHPRIARRREELIAAAEADPEVRAVVLDSPLLFEAGLNRLCDVVIFVDAPADQRAARLAAGRGWSNQELYKREKSQQPLDSKRARADYTIDNNSGLDHLRSKVERLLSGLLGQASSG